MGKKCCFYLLSLVLLPVISSAQLPGFSLVLTPTVETCSGNACLNFMATGTAPGATVLYAVYQLPNTTTPQTTTAATSFCGLTAGNYLVVATQTLNGQSSNAQQNATITSSIIDLSYAVSGMSEGCGESFSLKVTVVNGTGAGYEILSGPETRLLQASNVFTGLPGGTYVVRVTDICGEALVQTFTFFPSAPGLSVVSNPIVEPIDCETVKVTQQLAASSGTIAYPLQIVYTVNLPDGTQQSVTTTVNSGDPATISLVQDLLLAVDQLYSFSIMVTDACGNSVTKSGEISTVTPLPSIVPTTVTCDMTAYQVILASTATVITAPVGYAFPLPNVLAESDPGSHIFPMGFLPPGTYTVTGTDSCGNPYQKTITVVPPVASPPIFAVSNGCAEGFASIYLNTFKGNASVSLVSGPVSYSLTYPVDVTYSLDALGALRLPNLPAGDYVFLAVNICGQSFTVPVTIDGLEFTSDVQVIEHCGAFDVNLQYQDNSSGSINFYLQKLNPITGIWVHPLTNVPYVPGTAPSSTTGLSLANNIINLNIMAMGHFRVISHRVIFAINESDKQCINPLYEFDYNGLPDILDVYSFACTNNTFNVIVDAIGSAPLLYRITSMNSNPFLFENGTSNLFGNLLPGSYNFQVEDVCHNLVNQQLDISEPYPLTVTGEGICEGQTASIHVPYFPFLTYSWTKQGSTQVLSTTGLLEIPALSTTNLGTYLVHISSPDANSCINLTLTYVLFQFNPVARAGNDAVFDYCGTQGTIDLSTYLNGDFQSGGAWTSLDNLATLNGSLWDSSSAIPGEYQFVYTKTSDCSTDDSANFTVNLKPVPENPVIFADPGSCNSGPLSLHVASVQAGVSYQWNGPSGFTSTQTDPVIASATSQNSGIYSVRAFLDDCPSTITTLNVIIGELPAFSITSGCENNRMILHALSADGDNSPYTISWSGPQGFSASGETIDITGFPSGNYSLSAQNQQGCTSAASIQIDKTLCRFQQGISPNGDGNNDNFDLSGLGSGIHVKIFNRYGMKMYEQADYVDQWSGQDYNGNLLPSATYYYLIDLPTGEGKTGWVYLLRY